MNPGWGKGRTGLGPVTISASQRIKEEHKAWRLSVFSPVQPVLSEYQEQPWKTKQNQTQKTEQTKTPKPNQRKTGYTEGAGAVSSSSPRCAGGVLLVFMCLNHDLLANSSLASSTTCCTPPTPTYSWDWMPYFLNSVKGLWSQETSF